MSNKNAISHGMLLQGATLAPPAVVTSSAARNEDQKLVSHSLKMGYFIGYYIENVWEIWLIDFGRPNA